MDFVTHRISHCDGRNCDLDSQVTLTRHSSSKRRRRPMLNKIRSPRQMVHNFINCRSRPVQGGAFEVLVDGPALLRINAVVYNRREPVEDD